MTIPHPIAFAQQFLSSLSTGTLYWPGQAQWDKLSISLKAHVAALALHRVGIVCRYLSGQANLPVKYSHGHAIEVEGMVMAVDGSLGWERAYLLKHPALQEMIDLKSGDQDFRVVKLSRSPEDTERFLNESTKYRDLLPLVEQMTVYLQNQSMQEKTSPVLPSHLGPKARL